MKNCEHHTKRKAITMMVHDSEDTKHYYCDSCTHSLLENQSPLRLVWLKDIGIKTK